jgi:hypothetical protein
VLLPLAWVLVLGGALATMRQWRRARFPPGSPYPQREREDRLRQLPAAAAVLTLWVAALTVDAIWGHHASGSRVAIAATGIGGFTAAPLLFTTVYLRKPSWAIPPALRERPSELPRPRSRRASADRSGR